MKKQYIIPDACIVPLFEGGDILADQSTIVGPPVEGADPVDEDW